MDRIRVFIALELPSPVKVILSEVISRLRQGRERTVKWVDAEGIHLTLKFLGDIPAAKVADIIGAMERASGGVGSCMMELEGIGAFPNVKSPRVVWVGVGGDVSRIIKLQKRIDHALVPLGFPSERREFSPHLTLGRVRDKANRSEQLQLGETLVSFKSITNPPFRVTEVALIKSMLTKEGAVYERLGAVSLDSNRKKW